MSSQLIHEIRCDYIFGFPSYFLVNPYRIFVLEQKQMRPSAFNGGIQQYVPYRNLYENWPCENLSGFQTHNDNTEQALASCLKRWQNIVHECVDSRTKAAFILAQCFHWWYSTIYSLQQLWKLICDLDL